MVLTDMEHFLADVECLNVENASYWAKDNSKRILAFVDEYQRKMKAYDEMGQMIEDQQSHIAELEAQVAAYEIQERKGDVAFRAQQRRANEWRDKYQALADAIMDCWTTRPPLLKDRKYTQPVMDVLLNHKVHKPEVMK